MNNYTELIACPACLGQGPFPKYGTVMGPDTESNGYRAAYKSEYSVCLTCGLIFQNPRPDVSQFYSSGAYRLHLSMTQDEMDRDEQLRAKRLVKYIKEQNILFGSVLDVGSSRGSFMEEIIAEFPKLDVVMGVEPNRLYSKVNVVSSIDEVKDRKFDLVTCIHTFEHVPDPYDFMWKLSNLTSRYLLLEVPSLHGRVGALRFAHLTAWEFWPMQRLLLEHNLRPIRVTMGDDMTIIAERMKNG